MAAKRWVCTTSYWSGVTPRDACLWAMRSSITSGRVSGCSTSAVANAAIEPARALRWSPDAWLPRLNRSRRSSGWAANSFS